MEHKNLSGNQVCLKTVNNTDDGEMTFSGYGAFFGNVDSYGDIIQKGAFKATLKAAKESGDWPMMLAQHGYEGMTPVGVYTDMHEDDKGLYVEGKLANTQAGREIYELMKMSPRPAIKGLSIGYITTDAYYPTRDDVANGLYPKDCDRVIKSLNLLEVSIVSFPANKKATVTDVKSEEGVDEIENNKEAEELYNIFKEDRDNNTLSEEGLKDIMKFADELRTIDMFEELRKPL